MKKQAKKQTKPKTKPKNKQNKTSKNQSHYWVGMWTDQLHHLIHDKTGMVGNSALLAEYQRPNILVDQMLL